jgi:NAD(P)-dependent dehydrogenase (short-subunit alcohol dehydrogenase family)
MLYRYRSAIPAMTYQGGGEIVLTASDMGINALSRDCPVVEAWENCILLGWMAAPEEIAGILVFLTADQDSYLTSEVILVDGGRMLYDPSSINP